MQKVEELANTEIARQTGDPAANVVGEDDLASLDFTPPLSIVDVNKFKVNHTTFFYIIIVLNIHNVIEENLKICHGFSMYSLSLYIIKKNE